MYDLAIEGNCCIIGTSKVFVLLLIMTGFKDMNLVGFDLVGFVVTLALGPVMSSSLSSSLMITVASLA